MLTIKQHRKPTKKTIKADKSTVDIIRSRPDELQKLLKAGLDPNSFVEDSTLLFYAIQHKKFESFKILLENGADVNLPNKDDETIIQSICEIPDVKYLDLALKSGLKIGERDTVPEELSPISFAAMHGNCDILKQLVSAGLDLHAEDEDGNSALHLAAKTVNDPHIAECLYYGEKSNLNEQEYQKRLKDFREFEAIQNEKVTWLVKSGLAINSQNDFGDTPLLLAIKHQLLEVTKTLLDLKADVNSKNNNKETPLHLAIQYSTPKLVEMLLKLGAYKDAATNNDQYPIHLAAKCKFPVILKMLVTGGADVKAVNSEGQTALHLAASNIFLDSINLLLENGADLEAKDNLNQTAVHMVAMSENPEMIGCLGEYAPDFDVININGDSPLHFAARAGITQNIKFFEELGVGMNIRNGAFSTPLHEASLSKKLENVKMLISLGADKQAADEFDYTPLELVSEMGDQELINALK